jgi:hypothetical protein
VSSKIASGCDRTRASLGKTLAGEKPKAARTLFCGRRQSLPSAVSRQALYHFDPAVCVCAVSRGSVTEISGPVVLQAAAEAAGERSSLGSTQLQRSATQLEAGGENEGAMTWKVEAQRSPEAPHRKERPKAMSRARDANLLCVCVCVCVFFVRWGRP